MPTRNLVYEALALHARESPGGSRILTLLTAEAGLVDVFVFGGPKSKLRSLASPYASGRAFVYLDPVKDFQKLSDFEVRDSYPALRDELERIWSAGLVAELLIKTSGGGGDYPLVLELSRACLEALDGGGHVEGPILAFIWRLLSLIGLGPDPRHARSAAPSCGLRRAAPIPSSEKASCALLAPRARSPQAPPPRGRRTRARAAATPRAHRRQGKAAPPGLPRLPLARAGVILELRRGVASRNPGRLPRFAQGADIRSGPTGRGSAAGLLLARSGAAVRCFIALSLPDAAREALSASAAGFRTLLENGAPPPSRNRPKLAWVNADAYHYFTLAFLGRNRGRRARSWPPRHSMPRFIRPFVFSDDGQYLMPAVYNLCDISLFPVSDMKGKFDVPLAVIEDSLRKNSYNLGYFRFFKNSLAAIIHI